MYKGFQKHHTVNQTAMTDRMNSLTKQVRELINRTTHIMQYANLLTVSQKKRLLDIQIDIKMLVATQEHKESMKTLDIHSG